MTAAPISIRELSTTGDDGRTVIYRENPNLTVSHTASDDGGRHASGAVLAWLGVDDNHDEVLVQTAAGQDEIQAMEAAIASLQTSVATMRRIRNC
ncbi:hypothetical protein GCM10009616_08070 [Microlunatus lacustris]